MRWKMLAGVLGALAFLIPAAPAMARTDQPGLNAACETVERKVYKDIRELVTIDLDTATDLEIRVLTAQILAAANADSLAVLPDAIQEKLKGTPEELRAFLKSGMENAWYVDLRLSVVRTLTGAGTNVEAAAQKVLADGSIDTFLAYLNDGLWEARELDCASQPSPTPTAAPSGTPTGAPSPGASGSPAAPGGEGGGLPVTGADTAIAAGVGGALLVLGVAGYVIGRRRRARFVA
ncbi:LPXTG cell wall anchor domain-containing protein [Asanoa sp. NPDC049518]|uniref:LPXTG cell wall anchor domain-containing protein n=1 Tax=unclassified Asanoa TaxID=2685164 RepID=UPI003418DAF6